MSSRRAGKLGGRQYLLRHQRQTRRQSRTWQRLTTQPALHRVPAHVKQHTSASQTMHNTDKAHSRDGILRGVLASMPSLPHARKQTHLPHVHKTRQAAYLHQACDDAASGVVLIQRLRQLLPGSVQMLLQGECLKHLSVELVLAKVMDPSHEHTPTAHTRSTTPQRGNALKPKLKTRRAPNTHKLRQVHTRKTPLRSTHEKTQPHKKKHPNHNEDQRNQQAI
jgi:hypothetical protein